MVSYKLLSLFKTNASGKIKYLSFEDFITHFKFNKTRECVFIKVKTSD